MTIGPIVSGLGGVLAAPLRFPENVGALQLGRSPAPTSGRPLVMVSSRLFQREGGEALARCPASTTTMTMMTVTRLQQENLSAQ